MSFKEVPRMVLCPMPKHIPACRSELQMSMARIAIMTLLQGVLWKLTKMFLFALSIMGIHRVFIGITMLVVQKVIQHSKCTYGHLYIMLDIAVSQ